MRTIKFRAWDTITHTMTDVRALDFNDDGQAVCAVDSSNINGDLGCEWKLMEYTGLKDKNSEDIYEDDIVLRESIIPGLVKRYMGVIKFDDVGRWRIANDLLGYSKSMGRKYDSLKIIGNVYENPDLLRTILIDPRK